MSEDQMRAAYRYFEYMSETSANRDLVIVCFLIAIFFMLALGWVGRPIWAANIRYVVDKIREKINPK